MSFFGFQKNLKSFSTSQIKKARELPTQFLIGPRHTLAYTLHKSNLSILCICSHLDVFHEEKRIENSLNWLNMYINSHTLFKSAGF